ncbi:MAG: hypothetical protein KC496_08500 [Anaerolineae bacterium]|nr:hypothetical protein [Anaerolineae bacterium]
MDILIVVLRLLHILLGIIWVGFGVLLAWIMIPTAERTGERGQAMLRTFIGYSPIGTVFGISALGTTLAGLIMWPLRTENGYDLVAFGPAGDIVMSIGAVFGLLAFGHGATATGRYTGAYAAAAKAYDENPSPENAQALEDAKKKFRMHTNISAWLAVVAVVCMAGARYL